MTTDFRALCAELTDKLHGYASANPHHDSDALVTRARAALADEPAAGEPASITGQPSDEELALIYHDCCRGCEFMDQGGFENAARAVLARWGNPAPQPPVEGEVGELVAWLRGQDGGIGRRAIYSRIADLLHRLSPPQPVPVSERPWESEGWCAEDGRCWVWNRGSCEWWELVDSKLISYSSIDYTHCLPAHALPLPEAK